MSRYQLSIDDYPHNAEEASSVKICQQHGYRPEVRDGKLYTFLCDEKVEFMLAYGFDSVAGYFYQVYVSNEQAPIEDRDSWRGLSRHELLERFDALAVAIPDAHRSAIVLDLPF